MYIHNIWPLGSLSFHIPIQLDPVGHIRMLPTQVDVAAEGLGAGRWRDDDRPHALHNQSQGGEVASPFRGLPACFYGFGVFVVGVLTVRAKGSNVMIWQLL